jgi:hypothetical protein
LEHWRYTWMIMNHINESFTRVFYFKWPFFQWDLSKVPIIMERREYITNYFTSDVFLF